MAAQNGMSAPFEQIIQQLMSTENQNRAQAETLFNQAKQQPDLLVAQLTAVLRQSQSSEARALCAVLLRKVLTKDIPSLWPLLAPNVQSLVKVELLKSVQEEQERSILKKVCDTVAELAGGTAGQTAQWQELLPFMFQCAQAQDPRLVEASLLIFAQLAESMTDQLRPFMGTLHTLLLNCLSAQQPDVAVAAARATTAFVQALDEPSDRDKFQATLQPILSATARVLNSGDEIAAQEVLEVLIEVAEVHPRFFRRQLGEVVAAMMQIAEAESLESSTRQLAAECLVTLCEAREKAPGMMRKLPQFLGRFFQCLLGFLHDIEDEPEWHQAETDETETEGEGERYEFGQECLDRLALAVGGNALAPLAAQALGRLLIASEWRSRHAALICLAQIAEGCAKVLLKQIKGLVDMCLKGLTDPHAKVRWAGCQALGQLCTDLGPDLQAEEHSRVIPALLTVMEDFSQPRVQAHAAAAIVNFSESCESDELPPYLDALVARLLGLLQHGQKLVQEGVLTAMASLADAAKGHFAKYYEQVMPLLRQILGHASNHKAHQMLRAKALECISLVGMAIGRDRFREDAHAVLQYMQGLQAQELDPDDPTAGYMLQAGARLCKTLGEEFLPYLGAVMPSLLHSAQLKPDVEIADRGDDGNDTDEDDGEVETIFLGGKRISIRTSKLEEKATACNMLCCYADELKEGFFPYVEQVAGVMVPLLKFYFHEEVRSAAMSILPELLRSAKLASEKGVPGANAQVVKQLLDFVWQPLMDAMAKEPESDVLAAALEALEEILDVSCVPGMLTQQQLETAFAQFRTTLEESAKRRAERQGRHSTEDFDADEAEALQDDNEECELADQIASCLTVVLRRYGDAAMQLIDPLMPFLGDLLKDSSTSEERRIGLCVLDDIIEHSPAGAQTWMPHAIPVMLSSCSTDDANLRQCAVYGLGVVAQHRPEAFRPITNEIVSAIMQIVTRQHSKSDDSANATDNAVSALGKVIEHRQDCLDGAPLVATWLNHLPIRHDLTEAHAAHAQLLRLLEKSDTRVLGSSNSNLNKIAGILIKILGKGSDLADAETLIKAAAFLKQIQNSLPPDAINKLIAQLKTKDQANLQAALQA